MASTVPQEILARLKRLPAVQQRQALVLVESLERASHGAALAALTGSIPRADLAEMAAAIEADCEQVDARDWQSPPSSAAPVGSAILKRGRGRRYASARDPEAK